MPVYRGSCHCGNVTFEVAKSEPIAFAIDCDCSVCTKKGILHHPVQDEELTITCEPRELTLYQFHSGSAKHWFCATCGVHPFNRPRSDPSRYSVNLRCLDDFPGLAGQIEIRPFDGKNHPGDRA